MLLAHESYNAAHVTIWRGIVEEECDLPDNLGLDQEGDPEAPLTSEE
jgi:hypothetical protein